MVAIQKTRTRSINRYFLRILIPAVAFVSIVFGVLLAWNDYYVNKTSRLNSQKLIFETFSATIRQPLIQGSLIEARIRAEDLLRNNQVACIEIKAQSELIRNCKKENLGSGQHRMEESLFFGEDGTNWLGHLAITFDNSDLIIGIYKNAGKNVVAFVILAGIFFATLSLGFARLRSELSELLKIAENQDGNQKHVPTFRISEFAALGSKLSNQFDVSKSAIEAKAALDVARQVAHDIRSPIVSLQVALNAAQSKLDPKVRSVLNHSAQRISDIADDVINQHTPRKLGFETGQPIKKLPMSVNLSLQEMISEKELMCQKLPKVQIQLDVTVEDIIVEMRVSDFKRIISNLFDNAIHAVGEDGSITLTCSLESDYCRISLADDGIGIPEKVLREILEVGGSFGKPGGKGLGLQWVKQTLSDHGGRLEMSSTEGIGTTVTIFLPAQASKKTRVQAKANLSLAVSQA